MLLKTIVGYLNRQLVFSFLLPLQYYISVPLESALQSTSEARRTINTVQLWRTRSVSKVHRKRILNTRTSFDSKFEYYRYRNKHVGLSRYRINSHNNITSRLDLHFLNVEKLTWIVLSNTHSNVMKQQFRMFWQWK